LDGVKAALLDDLAQQAAAHTAGAKENDGQIAHNSLGSLKRPPDCLATAASDTFDKRGERKTSYGAPPER
jgi:hypothetical protein